MKQEINSALRSFLRLVRFLTWYAAGLATLFFLLPKGGLFLQTQYDSLGGTMKFAAVMGFFLLIAGWHVLGRRDRMREEVTG
jgi:hypothetical protein